MYWLCDECGWENEYSDAKKITECECCSAPASAKNIADAEKALARFHAEAEKRRKAELLKAQLEKRQKAINGFITGFTRTLKILPVLNTVVVALAVLWISVSIFTGESSISQVWTRATLNIQEITVLNRISTSFDKVVQFTGDQFENYYTAVKSNHDTLGNSGDIRTQENLKLPFGFLAERGSRVEQNTDLLFDQFSAQTERVGDNMSANGHAVTSLLSNSTTNLAPIGDTLSSSATNLFSNIAFFWEQASENVTELFNKLIKR